MTKFRNVRKRAWREGFRTPPWIEGERGCATPILLEALLVVLCHADFGVYLYPPCGDPVSALHDTRNDRDCRDIMSFAATSRSCMEVVGGYIEKHVRFFNPSLGASTFFRVVHAVLVPEAGAVYRRCRNKRGCAELLKRVPASVEHLVLGQSAKTTPLRRDCLPPALLSLRGIEEERIGCSPDYEVLSLPDTLLDLHLDSRFSLTRCFLPEGILRMTLHGCAQGGRAPWQHPLPRGLEELVLLTDERVGETAFCFGEFPQGLRKLVLRGKATALPALPAGLLHFKWDAALSGSKACPRQDETAKYEARGCVVRGLSGLPSGLQTVHLPLVVFDPDGADAEFPPSLLEIRLDRTQGPLPRVGALVRDLFLGVGDHGSLPALPRGLRFLFAGSGSIEAFPPDLSGFACADSFSSPLPALPDSILILALGARFLHPLSPIERFPEGPPRVLPSALAEAYLGHGYDGCIGPIPEGLRVLVAGDRFRGAGLGRLPDTMEMLVLGDSFNAPIALPPHLTTLHLGNAFDSPFVGDLPQSLTSLKLGNSFNRPLGPLPASLLCLMIGDSFSRPLGPLPEGLIHLILGNAFHNRVGPFPRSLQSLHLGDGFAGRLRPLPPSIKHLHLGASFNGRLPLLPQGIVSVVLGEAFRHPLPPLPDSLCSLGLPAGYDGMVPKLSARLSVDYT